MTATKNTETLGFQAEAKQLLHLMIHSLYSNREIFLRELISNASDAIDKLRFEALANDSLYEGDSELKVQIDFDAEAKTITLADNGIGMTKEEVIDHLVNNNLATELRVGGIDHPVTAASGRFDHGDFYATTIGRTSPQQCL